MKQKWTARAILAALALMLAFAPALAGSLSTATTGTVSGLQNNTQINAIAAALAALNQASSAPTASSTGLASTAGVVWHDTSANILKLRDQADTTWLQLGSIDETNKIWMPRAQGQILPALLRGFIDGCETGAPGGAATLTIGPCSAVDNTDSYFLLVPSTFTKTLSPWAAGTGNGGLDAGSVLGGQPYFLYDIADLATGGVDYLISQANGIGSSPTMPSGWTVARGPIAWFYTDGFSHIAQYQQRGDEFIFGAPVNNINGTSFSVTGSRVMQPVWGPLGYQFDSLFRLSVQSTSTSTGAGVIVTSPDETDHLNSSETSLWGPAIGGAAVLSGGAFQVRTNTQEQVGIRVWNNAADLWLNVYGFIWNRGRNN